MQFMKKMFERKQLVERLLLCDPITQRGINSLRELGLSNKIQPRDFFDGSIQLWTAPNSIESTSGEGDTIEQFSPSIIVQQNALEQRRRFERAFMGEMGSTFTVLIGEEGSGKSIELQRMIYQEKRAFPYRFPNLFQNADFEAETTPEVVLIDCEALTIIVHGNDYTFLCPDTNSVLWLFCTKVLSTLYNYIVFTKQIVAGKQMGIDAIFNEYFGDRMVGTTAEKHFFTILSLFYEGKKNNVDVLAGIQSLLSIGISKNENRTIEEATHDISELLYVLFLVMICINDNDRKYSEKKKLSIIVDNLEDLLITISNNKVERQIQNEEIRQIMKLLQEASMKITDTLYHVERETAFTINLCVRRTTWDQRISPYFLGNIAPLYDRVYYYTNKINTEDIWWKKRCLWENHLGSMADDEENKYLQFVDSFFGESEIPFRQLLSGTLSHKTNFSIRCQAHCESSILWRIYKLLFLSGKGECQTLNVADHHIDIVSHYILQRSTKNICTRDFFQHALIQYYYMDQVSRSLSIQDDERECWRDLNIGYISDNRQQMPLLSAADNSSQNVMMDWVKISFIDDDNTEGPSYRSLLHRILSSLPTEPEIDSSGNGIPCYRSITLLELMEKLFTRPDTTLIKDIRSIYPFKQLARILLAASHTSISNEYSPLIYLHIRNVYGYESFELLLKDLWESGIEEREPGGKFDTEKYTVEISENGLDFISGQASFDYFAGLYCYSFPPLYFIRSRELITHIIAKVFNAASELCAMYELETERFYHGSMMNNNRHAQSFRKLVRDLHSNYLYSYFFFIECNWKIIGIREEDVTPILRNIMRFVHRYKGQNEYGERITDINHPDYRWNCFASCF